MKMRAYGDQRLTASVLCGGLNAEVRTDSEFNADDLIWFDVVVGMVDYVCVA